MICSVKLTFYDAVSNGQLPNLVEKLISIGSSTLKRVHPLKYLSSPYILGLCIEPKKRQLKQFEGILSTNIFIL